MNARLYVGPIAGVLMTIAFGCSSSPPPDQTVTEFCSDWADAYCQLSSICNFDVTACTTYQVGVCNAFASAAQASGGRAYSQPAGVTCINQLKATFGGSPTTVSVSTLTTITDLCNRAFTGNQVTNKSCSTDYDCASGLVCAASVIAPSMKVCTTVTPKQLGAICLDPGDECQGDSYCALQQGADPQCVPTPAEGAACSATLPCGPADRCIGSTCQPLVAMGDTCASNADCATGYCDLYPPVQCTDGLTFARGSYDCQGISGADVTSSGIDAGTTSTVDAGGGSLADAATGG